MPDTGTTAPIDDTIRPFKFRASDDALADLKRRITATRWPSKELVAMQGVQLATMQKLATYWASRLRLAQGRVTARRPAAIRHQHRRRSTSTSSTFARSTEMRFR